MAGSTGILLIFSNDCMNKSYSVEPLSAKSKQPHVGVFGRAVHFYE